MPVPIARLGANQGLLWILLVLLACLHLWTNAPPGSGLSLLLGAGDGFAALAFHLTALPRLLVTLLVGAAMGLSGCVLQLVTQNRLVSPMTLGVSSGAWLGLLLATFSFPTFAAHHGEWAALGGSLATLGLALWIAGRRGINGLPLVLAGMALNLLLGALASALLLLHAQSTRGLFVWGAGDLTQLDWRWVLWLWPRLLPVALVLLIFARRPLTLLQLGSLGASGRGLTLWPTVGALFLAALWLTAASVTAVGLIGFIGLLAPNLAQLCGARRVAEQLLCSTLLGMALLLASDTLAVLASGWLGELVPSGATAALVGAPALLWLSQRRLQVEDAPGLGMAVSSRRPGWVMPSLLVAVALGLLFLNLMLAPGLHGWSWRWPTPLEWSLRWPRLLAAVVAGGGLGVAGSLLQRLLRNPLASPDMLGLTAGATLAVLLVLLVSGSSLFWLKAPLASFVGSLAVLGVLLALGRRHQYSPNIMILVGIALTALLNTLMQFVLTQGSAESLTLLGWLAGSSYRVSPPVAVALALGTGLLLVPCLASQRALTLLDLGDQVAASRGLDVPQARLGLLSLIALLCALVTSLLGPVGFLGLLAPHVALLLGARRVLPHLLLAALLGGLFMLLADWLGRVLVFPRQIPVGLVASVICGLYFIALLLRRRSL